MTFDGVAFVAPIPTCPVHGGDLRLNFRMDRWECAGWDGEGCPVAVNAEDMDWTEVGTGAVFGPTELTGDDLPVTGLDLVTGTSTVTVPFSENARWALSAATGTTPAATPACPAADAELAAGRRLPSSGRPATPGAFDGQAGPPDP